MCNGPCKQKCLWCLSLNMGGQACREYSIFLSPSLFFLGGRTEERAEMAHLALSIRGLSRFHRQRAPSVCRRPYMSVCACLWKFHFSTMTVQKIPICPRSVEHTDVAKKYCPRLRELAPTAKDGTTQPFWPPTGPRNLFSVLSFNASMFTTCPTGPHCNFRQVVTK